MRRLYFALAVAALVAALPATADIYNNGTPNLDIGPWSDIDAEIAIADDFSLSQVASTITDVHWWGYYAGDNSPVTDSFWIYILEDSNSHPTYNPIAAIWIGDAGRMDTGMNVTGDLGASFDLYSYGAFVDPIPLIPGDVYWLLIVNDTADDANDNWAWAPSSDSGNAHWLPINEDPSWRQYSSELAFYLTNDTVVPEPASAALLVLGLAALATRARRRTS